MPSPIAALAASHLPSAKWARRRGPTLSWKRLPSNTVGWLPGRSGSRRPRNAWYWQFLPDTCQNCSRFVRSKKSRPASSAPLPAATALKPLVGRAGNGPGDAAVLQPLLDEHSTAGIVLSNGVNPLYGSIDPYHMAMNAVDEALRNLAAVGGDIEKAAILDNFCWGNPTDPLQLGMLVRAVKGCYDAAAGFGTPFISGKDSLNNEYRSA